MKKIASIIFLLVLVLSGCSVLANSAKFYRDNPPWVQYRDDRE